MTTVFRRTPLYDWHASHGGRIVEFAGWEMPVLYRSIADEHLAARAAVGLFDISHMGRIRLDGEGAPDFLETVLSRRVEDMALGEVRYALLTNDAGGILDDVLVYRLQDGAGTTYQLLVVNAGNREKVLQWLRPRAEAAAVVVSDLTQAWCMLAVQGPRAMELVSPLVESNVMALAYYTAAETLVQGHGGIVSRTGYTGEDGCELIVGPGGVVALWEELVARARSLGGLPAGLGARDTLRLEAAMPLYGHELNEEIDPVTAGLRFAVDVDRRSFPGRDAIARKLAEGTSRKRVGLQLSGRRVPRQGCAVWGEDAVVGEVTSGTFSPTLNVPIAMAYVESGRATVGAELAVDVRGNREPARVVKLPFYRRAPPQPLHSVPQSGKK